MESGTGRAMPAPGGGLGDAAQPFSRRPRLLSGARLAGWALIFGSILFVWGCGGGGGSGGAGGSGNRDGSPGQAPGLVTSIPTASVNALTTSNDSIHFISGWFVSGDSAFTPTVDRPYCYAKNRYGHAGGECYYEIGDQTVRHNPDDFTFSNVRGTGTLPNDIPQFTADVVFTPSATDAANNAVEPIFPGAGAAYSFWGGWLEHGAFGVLSTDQGVGDRRVVAWAGLNFGRDDVGPNPTPAGEQTTARWTGAMVGQTDGGDRVTGTMRLIYRFNAIRTGPGHAGDDRIDVSFHDVTGGRRIDPFEDMLVRDATFAAPAAFGRRLDAGFVGNPHSEEVLGQFYSNSVTGAFGGRRQP